MTLHLTKTALVAAAFAVGGSPTLGAVINVSYETTLSFFEADSSDVPVPTPPLSGGDTVTLSFSFDTEQVGREALEEERIGGGVFLAVFNLTLLEEHLTSPI